MKLLALFFSSILLLAACSLQKVESQNKFQENLPQSQNETIPVLVELFTSEGCSSCPAADRALAFLEKEQPYPQAEVITLALHVDYWNRLGWTDEFSSPLFSQRQEYYAEKFKLGSVYTPQMVVDGGTEFTGSNLGAAAKAIMESAKTPKAKIDVTAKNEKVELKIFELPKHSDSTVFLAIAEDKLSSNVKRGENAGQTLEHISVVRELKAIGQITPDHNSYETRYEFGLNPKWKRENLKLVIFVQENESRRIYGLAKVLLEQS